MVFGTGVAVTVTETDRLAKTAFHSKLASADESAIEKYASVMVGRRGLKSLIAYELACWLASPMPGALGFVIRRKIYSRLFGSCGAGLVLGRNVTIRHPKRLHLGNNIIVDDNCVLDAKGDADERITLGDGVILGRNTILSCKGGSIEIGANTNISANCMVTSESQLTIGSNVLIAGMVYIVAGGNHGTERTDIPIIQQPMSQKGGVKIGDNCWLGANITVLDGVTVGRDSVIGAGSVLTRSIPEFAIALGAPARLVRYRKSGEKG